MGKLSTILGPKSFTEYASEGNDIMESSEFTSINRKFFSLKRKIKAEILEDDTGIYSCADETGTIYYKQVDDFRWFMWRPL
jgi:hypothetical protein